MRYSYGDNAYPTAAMRAADFIVAGSPASVHSELLFADPAAEERRWHVPHRAQQWNTAYARQGRAVLLSSCIQEGRE